MTDVLLRGDSAVGAVTPNSVSLAGLVPFEPPEVSHSTLLRSNSVGFVELVSDINKHVFPDDAAILFSEDASPGQDSCSAISSNMDFETFTGTAESTLQLACAAAAPLSWTSDQSTAADAGAGAPINPFPALVSPLDSLFTSAISDEEVMSKAFTAPSEEAKPEQVQALAELFRHDSLESPDLSAFGSRDSVYSAPGLDEMPLSTCDEPPQKLAPSVDLKRSASAAGRMPVSLATLTRSLSVAAPPQLSRSYSTAGPGTNRPPKEGSQSALLPKDKLNRKRAAARRYYHNQRNKAVDYEVAIARLETENQALSKELVNALQKLEHLRKSEVSQMSVC